MDFPGSNGDAGEDYQIIFGYPNDLVVDEVEDGYEGQNIFSAQDDNLSDISSIGLFESNQMANAAFQVAVSGSLSGESAIFGGGGSSVGGESIIAGEGLSEPPPASWQVESQPPSSSSWQGESQQVSDLKESVSSGNSGSLFRNIDNRERSISRSRSPPSSPPSASSSSSSAFSSSSSVAWQPSAQSSSSSLFGTPAASGNNASYGSYSSYYSASNSYGAGVASKKAAVSKYTNNISKSETKLSSSTDSSTIIGIDLGCTYCRVAICNDGNVEILRNENGKEKTPCYISFYESNDAVIFGEDALQRGGTHPFNTVCDVKSMCGKSYNNTIIQNGIRGQWNFSVVPGGRWSPFATTQLAESFTSSPTSTLTHDKDNEDEDVPIIRVQTHNGVKCYTPEELSGMFLKHIVDMAVRRLERREDERKSQRESISAGGRGRGRGRGGRVRGRGRGAATSLTRPSATTTTRSSSAQSRSMKAVITVPAFYTSAQRAIVERCAKAAGLTVLRLVSDPVAAAFAHLRLLEQQVRMQDSEGGDSGTSSTLLPLERGWNPSTLPVERTVLVIDVGGRTTSATVMKEEEGVFEVIVTKSNECLGGYNLDACLARYVVDEVRSRRKLKQEQQARKSGEETKNTPSCTSLETNEIGINHRAMWMLRKSCEEAKRALTTFDEAVVRVEEADVDISVSKHTFETICRNVFADITNVVSEVLDAAVVKLCEEEGSRIMEAVEGRSESGDGERYVQEAQEKLPPRLELHKILLTGGSCRIPMLRKMFHDVVKPYVSVEVIASDVVGSDAAEEEDGKTEGEEEVTVKEENGQKEDRKKGKKDEEENKEKEEEEEEKEEEKKEERKEEKKEEKKEKEKENGEDNESKMQSSVGGVSPKVTCMINTMTTLVAEDEATLYGAVLYGDMLCGEVGSDSEEEDEEEEDSMDFF